MPDNTNNNKQDDTLPCLYQEGWRAARVLIKEILEYTKVEEELK